MVCLLQEQLLINAHFLAHNEFIKMFRYYLPDPVYLGSYGNTVRQRWLFRKVTTNGASFSGRNTGISIYNHNFFLELCEQPLYRPDKGGHPTVRHHWAIINKCLLSCGIN
ncbi:hypothetical protein BsWGS_05562 [Bradybaena similaris]